MLKKIKYKFLRRLIRVLLVIILVFTSLFYYLKLASIIKPPEVGNLDWIDTLQVEKISDNAWQLGNNWIRQNEAGLWEMYIEGEAFERGVIIGKLSEKLIKSQEEVFVAEIKKYIPSEFYMNFLRVTITYFNRHLDKNIPEEYLKEIYGISLFASDEFNAYGKPFDRILNYHSAHDIGHTLQNYNLVGCSSFSVWNSRTADSSILTGRNFDFYFGDDFARNKIVLFINPDDGYKFSFITWGGMIGAVSGMNEKGLTVTVNAARSEIPTSSATPIPLLAREILQYASTIEEAKKIADARKLFMSESFLISSAKDGKTVIIEKSPNKTGILEPEGDKIICTNHYQSETFKYDSINVLNMREGATSYRFKRLNQLVEEKDSISPFIMAKILRDRNGLDGKDIGNGNEKALNQLIAHHSIIFKPQEKLFWISTSPNIIGKYLAYNLDSIFNIDIRTRKEHIDETALMIPEDWYLYGNGGYHLFQQYIRLTDSIKQMANEKTELPDGFIETYISSNRNYYEVYKELGEYFEALKKYNDAISYYEIGLKKEINSLPAKRFIEEHIETCKQKQSK